MSVSVQFFIRVSYSKDSHLVLSSYWYVQCMSNHCFMAYNLHMLVRHTIVSFLTVTLISTSKTFGLIFCLFVETETRFQLLSFLLSDFFLSIDALVDFALGILGGSLRVKRGQIRARIYPGFQNLHHTYAYERRNQLLFSSLNCYHIGTRPTGVGTWRRKMFLKTIVTRVALATPVFRRLP